MRLCKPGDTICTVTRYGEAGYLHETPQNCEAVAYANSLIRAGRWRVCRCGECGRVVEECQCVEGAERCDHCDAIREHDPPRFHDDVI